MKFFHKNWPKIFKHKDQANPVNSINDFEKLMKTIMPLYKQEKPDLDIHYLRTDDVRNKPNELKWFQTWSDFLEDRLKLHKIDVDHEMILYRPYIDKVLKLQSP